VLLSASPGIESDAERAARREADEALARSLEDPTEGGLAGFVDRWAAHPLFAGEARLGHRHLRRARAERLAGSARGYAASLRGMGPRAPPPHWGRPGALRAALRDRVPPVAGEEAAADVELVRRMAEALPEAVVEILPNAGHAVHREAPEAVARAILEAIGDLGGE
jgi:2-succinyl-6-hydroxy-2,4-cyclohexadiene-1-carboxylate synthase